MKAVIMAGGKGTRISAVASDIPKPMIKLCGKPVLQWQIECLERNGISEIRLVVGHLAEKITEFFGDGKNFNAHISYFREEEPLGTAGALFQMEDLTEDFLLLCGDTIFDIDFDRAVEFHKKNRADATLFTHPNGHPFDSQIIQTEILPPSFGGLPVDSKRVAKWIGKDEPRGFLKNRVNAGIEIISPNLLEFARKNISAKKIDLDRDILKPAVQSRRIFAYDTSEYIKDMGTVARFGQVSKDIERGIVAARNLRNKQKAVFLDRDGVLNENVGFLTRSEQLTLLPNAAHAVKKINESGFLAIVVTNQPVIARGETTFDELAEIHAKLETLLGDEGAYLDAIYFCPHHPNKGFSGERPEYKTRCECRKPAPGMILQAAKDFNIDISQSFMVGDGENDILAGKNAGCKENVLVTPSLSLFDFASKFLP